MNKYHTSRKNKKLRRILRRDGEALSFLLMGALAFIIPVMFFYGF